MTRNAWTTQEDEMSAEEATVERVARAIWTVRDKRFPDRVRRPEPDKLDMASGAWSMVMEDARAAIAAMPGWMPIESAPRDQMFIWAYRRDGKWSVGLAYRNVSGGWSDAYGHSDAPQYATHWRPLQAPPEGNP
jgi:hypothetical protein